MEQKYIKVKILEVYQQANTVLVQNEYGEEDELPLGGNTKIQYARTGDATISMDNGQIVYLRMNSPPPRNVSPRRQFNRSNYSGGYRQGYQHNSFKQANEVKQHYYDSAVEKVEGVTLEEYKATYNALASKNWVTASQVFQTAIVKPDAKDPKVNHILYDAIIYLKVKKEGVREQPVEEEPWD